VRTRIPDARLVDYARKPLAPAEILEIVRLAGGVAPVLNARHATAVAHGWKLSPPDAEAFAEAAAREPNLLRRPIAVRDGTVAVGSAAVAALLA
jgi:arsenate reductase-like glutaredoxin family protein